MMARTSSSIIQSLAEIEQRPSVWGVKVGYFYQINDILTVDTFKQEYLEIILFVIV